MQQGGGFIGVDIFFVISGYLISGIIFRELRDTGSFSLINFYKKRIARILPNLSLLLVVALLFLYFIGIAREISDLGKSIKYSAFFGENFYLIKYSKDYFASGSEANVLLHVWSLAIEEQFYLIYPVICMILWKVIGKTWQPQRQNIILFVLIFFFIASFLSCLVEQVVLKNKVEAYYLPQVRFWELLAGALVSYLEIFKGFSASRYSKTTRNIGATLSLVVMIGSVFYIDSNNYPGIQTLFPIIGSSLFIFFGPDTVANKLISNRPLIFVGLISYSLYLWHWPIIKILEAFSIDFQKTQWGALALVLTFFVSVVVYRFIETPFRQNINNKYCVFWLCLVLCLGITGGLISKYNVTFSELQPTYKQKLYLRLNKDWEYPENLIKTYTKSGNIYYTNDKSRSPEVIFIGDSHMEQLSPAIKKLANEKSIPIAFVTAGGCSISLTPDAQVKDDCQRAIQSLKELLVLPSVKRVVHAELFNRSFPNFSSNRKRTIELEALYKEVTGRGIDYKILFDVPNGSFIRAQYKERVKELYGNEFDPFVKVPVNGKWEFANTQIEKIIQSKDIIKEVPEKVCPSGVCDTRHYKDDNHLRASYVKSNCGWLQIVFEGLK